MPENDNIKYIKRCLELAARAEGKTYPNPLVGAVIVHNGTIIGEGFHMKAGDPHAEVNAINSVSDKSTLIESTLYVNLEPCSHFGKTPPCTEYIISHRIPRIVVGSTDTSEKVNGKGINRLRESGSEVISGVLEEECRHLNRRFFTFNEKKRPYIILKWAQTGDGFLDSERLPGADSRPLRITGDSERILVHRWRSEEGAILVGGGTARADNPMLNVRDWKGTDPVRIILSSSGNLPADLSMFRTNGINIVLTHNKDAEFNKAEKILLRTDKGSAGQVAGLLYDRGIQSVIIEGGAEILEHFISASLWDEARIFRGNQSVWNGPAAPVVDGRVILREDTGTCSLEVVMNENAG